MKSRPATTNSAPSPPFSSTWPALCALAALALAASWLFWRQGSTLAYGDAEAHLNIARRILDSRAPGVEQFGTVWLPLPHAAMLPFVRHDSLWRTGLAGAIPSSLAFIFGGFLFFLALRKLFGSGAAAWAGLAAWALNPNLLYLQAAPMSEPYSLCAIALLIFLLVHFLEKPSLRLAAACGLALSLGALTRYEIWVLIPVAALVVFARAGGSRLPMTLAFSACAALGPLSWLAHNLYFYSDPLEFYRGQWSALAINRGANYPGFHDWPAAFRYYGAAALGCLGAPLVWIGAAGLAVALWRRQWAAAVVVLSVPAFYVLSLYSSGTPIYVPYLWPHSWYNTRYGLSALPAAAFGAAALSSLLPGRARPAWAAILAAACAAPWLLAPDMEGWLCWKEAQVNGEGRRSVTRQAAQYLGPRYRHGDGILLSFGDPAGILRQSGIRISESLHEGDGPLFQAVLARPDLFMWEEWAICVEGDRVSKAMARLKRGPRRYERVRAFSAAHTPAIEIWRHIQGKDPA